MIKFFSKIRQQLLTENKFSKYLLYAIGEIILVVIGILIALQINNYNDSNKEKRELHEYLAKIKSNLESDIKILDSLKTKRIDINLKCQKVYQGFMENSFDLNANVNALEAMVEFYFVPNLNGYEALKNSTYLGKINGTRVDSLLDNNILNGIIKSEISYNTFIENMEVKFLANHNMTGLSKLYYIGIDELKKDPESFKKIIEQAKIIFNDNAFKAIVSRSVWQITLLTNDYDQLTHNGENTIKEISAVLNE